MSVNMKDSVCALALCVFGFPDPKDKSRRLFPTVDSAVKYILYGGELHGTPEE